MQYELQHHGIIGQKWGKRNGPPYPLNGSKAAKKTKPKEEKEEKKKQQKKKESPPQNSSKSAKNMTDAELKDRVARLELEKKYKTLMRETQAKSHGKAFVNRVLEKSAENIATQLVTNMMGRAVNKAFAKALNDPEPVNPKKGQRDKK